MEAALPAVLQYPMRYIRRCSGAVAHPVLSIAHLVLAVILALAAVSAAAQPTGSGSGAVLHIAGTYEGGDREGACYWKDGARTDFDGDHARGIAVVDGDVYVAGWYTKGGPENIAYTACYWKNGARTDLPGSFTNAGAMAVWGGDVYIAGSTDGDTTRKACYWKNGTRTNLDGAAALGIAVAGGDLYVAGWYGEGSVEGSVYTACYWKNGARTDLPPGAGGRYSCAVAIAVEDKDLYLAGWYLTGDDSTAQACYWNNGTVTDLPGLEESTAFAIVVLDGDVYAAGYYYDGSLGKACYWKNGERTELGDGFAYAIVITGE